MTELDTGVTSSDDKGQNTEGWVGEYLDQQLAKERLAVGPFMAEAKWIGIQLREAIDGGREAFLREAQRIQDEYFPQSELKSPAEMAAMEEGYANGFKMGSRHPEGFTG